MTDREALTTAMYDAEDNRCSGYPGGCCAPSTHGSPTAISAALADAGYVVVRAEDVERWKAVGGAAACDPVIVHTYPLGAWCWAHKNYMDEHVPKEIAS